MDKDSKFMTDHSEGDKGKEAVMNFELSWVLRMAADEEYIKDKPIFRLFSKYMLCRILNISPSTVQIITVKVWKEWEYTDLCAEIDLEINGVKESRVVLIESKVYTRMKPKQRDNYPNIVKQYYKDKTGNDCSPHQVLITCAETNAEFKKAKDFCKNTEWNVLSIYDIILDLNIETESELFNEFWIYNWRRLTD